MLTWQDWTVVCIPIALAIMGAIVSIRPPERKTHWLWFVGFLILGAVCAGTTLWQLRGSRKEEADRKQDEANARERLHTQIQILKQQVTALGENTKPKPAVLPELSLILVWPKSPDVLIYNPSNAVAYKPYYLVALWNLNARGGELMQPLPMSQSHIGEYVKPHEYWGPNQMMALTEVRAKVHAGDRLFGIGDLNCPNCTRKNYWIYIQDGVGGWYAETMPRDLIDMDWFTKALPEIATDPEKYLTKLVPPRMRKAIADHR